MKNADTLQPFLIEQADLRGRMVRLEDSLNTIIGQHNYPEVINRYLTETIVMTTLLAGMLKFEGILTVQIMGKSMLKTMVADITHDGNIRAYAGFDEDKIARLTNSKDLSFKQLAGDEAVMAFTIDQSATKERYQGLVQLEGEDITDWLTHYFKQSEQLSTAFKMAINGDEDTIRAAAIMIQSLPQQKGKEQEDDNWKRATMLLDTAKDDEMLSEELETNGLLFRLFHEDGVRVFDALTIQAACRCTAEKVKHVLSTLSEDELNEIKNQDNMIETSCQFCSKSYHFNMDEIISEKKG